MRYNERLISCEFFSLPESLYLCFMQEIEFSIEGDYIELLGLLKVTGIAQTGGHAKMIVEDEEVMRNGELEIRKRAKLVAGDIIEVSDEVRILLK